MPEWVTILTQIIKDLGLPVALVGYYVYKDWVWSGKLLNALARNTTLIGLVAKKLDVDVPDEKEAA
jgi:hypothetical protein